MGVVLYPVIGMSARTGGMTVCCGDYWVARWVV